MEGKKPDFNEFYSNMAKGFELYTEIMREQSGKMDGKASFMGDKTMNSAFFDAFSKLASDPKTLSEENIKLHKKMTELWMSESQSFLGKDVSQEERKDKRFSAKEWHEMPMFNYMKEAYLIYADWLLDLVKNTDGLDEKERKKIEFYTRQFLDSISPSNFLWTNPHVLNATLESNAENLVKGLKNLAQDLKNGKISQTDMSAFELGKDLAATEGQVVFQNDLMQLIQYEPTTKKVHETPLLFIPAWINKFYIADLSPHNSLVKWMLDQGHTVFMISWVNPTEAHKDKGFEDYIKDGTVAAIDKICEITGQKKINAMGYCLGGTLLATTISYLKSKKRDKIKAASFLTTLLDFSDVGEIEVFIDEEQVDALEKRMSEKGYLEASEMAMTFSMLRGNDLIWSFVINNYLLGKTPFPFDILYWNSDSTRMPAKMHSFYLRNMYLENLLSQGKLEVDGVKIDLTKIETPSFFLSTKKDHISPWQTTYKGAQLFKNAKFILADSGHVAGVVNPPASAKYHHWEGEITKTAASWEKSAKEIKGSWWTSWDDWCSKMSGKKIDARKVKEGIEPAPGSYVKEK